jgi:hypothetical protein
MLKNYTSTVPVSRSIGHIEDLLIFHGAKNIMKEIDPTNKRIEAVCFIITLDGKDIPFKLAAHVENVETILLAKVKKRTPSGDQKIKEQAERTAWKLISDHIEISLALVEIKQRDLRQTFMADIYFPAKQKTYYEIMMAKGFNLLPEKT